MKLAGPRALWALASLLLVRVSAQSGGCVPVKDSVFNTLRTVVGPQVHQDSWCSDHSETSTVDKLMDGCEAFCGHGNIPLLMGLNNYGFPQKDIDALCLSSNTSDFIHYDPDLMTKCRQAAGALRLIKTRAADLVKAVNITRLAQLQFRKGIAESAAALAAKMSSDEFRRQMMSVDEDQRLPEYRKLLGEVFESFTASGQLHRDLSEALEAVRDAAKALNASLTINMPQVDFFVNSCGEMLTSVGPSNEYLLDQCNQVTSNCIESEKSRHVGCCCGAVPLAGIFGITGEGSPGGGAASGGGGEASDKSSRRLEGEEEELLDVCGEALITSRAERAARESDLSSTPEGLAVLEEYRAQIAEAYPDYASRCEGSRRLATASEPAEAQPSQPHLEPPGAARELTAPVLVGCDPKPATLDTGKDLKAAFWKGTESLYCKDQPSRTDAGLMDVCKDFCGDSLPVLIGGINFGFNHTAMDDICLGNGFMSREFDEVDECHDYAIAFHAVEVKVASFTSRVNVLDTKKLAYEAAIKEGVKSLKESIRARAEKVLQDAAVGSKVDAYRDFLEEETASMTKSGSDRQQVLTAAKSVKSAGEELQTTLSDSLNSLDLLLSNCNQLYSAQGSQREYLLDVCPQTSTECMDSSLGRHSGCCCAYSPLLAIGMTAPPAHAIPGIDAAELRDETGLARVAATVRSRMLSTSPKVVDICAESWTRARSDVEAAEKRIQELGHAEVLTQAQQKFDIKYPELACGQEAECFTDTGGTCQIWYCSESRGPTDCADAICICKDGYCLQDGKCTKSESSNSGVVAAANRQAAIALGFPALAALVVFASLAGMVR